MSTTSNVYLSTPAMSPTYLTTYDIVTPSLNAGQRMGFYGARVQNNPASIQPDRNGSRNWTYVDDYTNRLLARGLGILIELQYGATGANWVTANSKRPLLADYPYLSGLHIGTVNRIIANGMPKSKIRIKCWNEPDGTVGGGDGAGNINSDPVLGSTKEYLQYALPFYKAAFPDIVIEAPNFSYNLDTPASTGIKAGNLDANMLSALVNTEGFGVSLYKDNSNMWVPYCAAEYRDRTKQKIDAVISSVDGFVSLAGRPILVNETGLDYDGAGFISSFVSRGGEKELARYRVQQLAACLGHSRVSTIVWFRAINQDASDDARTGGTFGNKGTLSYNTLKPYKNTYLGLGRVLGKTMIEADELAYWGSWASEPV